MAIYPLFGTNFDEDLLLDKPAWLIGTAYTIGNRVRHPSSSSTYFTCWKNHTSGAWDGAITYALNDLVYYDSQVWVSLQNTNLNKVPGVEVTYWAVFVSGPGSTIDEPNVGTSWRAYWQDKDMYFDMESDAQSNAVITTNVGPEWMEEVTEDNFSYVFNDFWDITAVESDEILFEGVAPIDLSPLVPDKFLKSQTMMDLLAALNIEVGIWIKNIYDLQYLHDPNTVGEDYIQYLADLIGLTFIEPETSTASDLRQQLLEATNWYKIKGTYGCMSYIAGLSGLAVNIYDMYSSGGWSNVIDTATDQVVTNDYHRVTNNDITPYVEPFAETTWFGAKYEEENPPGIPENYFKTPHFVMEMVLSRYYPGNDATQQLVANYSTGFDYGTTFTSLPIVPNSIRISLSLNGASGILVGQDDGSGNITSSPESTYSIDGSINYVTGAIGVTLSPTIGSLDRLIVTYHSYSSWYLWHDNLFSRMGKMVEQVRPVNTVPHFRCLLNARTDDTGDITTIPETQVRTKVLTSWVIPRRYFDENWEFDKLVWALTDVYEVDDRVTHGLFAYVCIEPHTADASNEPGTGVDWETYWIRSDVYFDQSLDAFLSSITRFKVGTGNIGGDPGDALVNIVSPEPMGFPITSFVSSSGIVTFTMEIPKEYEYSNLTEIGLFQEDGSTMVISTTMPAVDKTAGIALKIVFTIGS